MFTTRAIILALFALTLCSLVNSKARVLAKAKATTAKPKVDSLSESFDSAAVQTQLKNDSSENALVPAQPMKEHANLRLNLLSDKGRTRNLVNKWIKWTKGTKADFAGNFSKAKPTNAFKEPLPSRRRQLRNRKN